MNSRSSTLVPETARANEAAILNAALEAFSQKGFNGASMRDVARGAGTSLSNLYNYFPSKSDLLAALLRMANDELLNRIETAVAGAGRRATDQLRAAVEAHVRFVVEHQNASLVALSEIRYLTGAARKRVVAARDRTQGLYEEIVAAGAAGGEFGTPHPEDAARNLVSMLSAISTWYSPGGRLDPDALAAQHARFSMALLETNDRS
ncbi:TetR/AcrR family transcriptional regulator [Amycolatopsis sp. K13G38]|uniref:TetR/AcrR family transcriptional regulator n=1 Tax=Amycolatopsis acididurans TaxID=2724524 RepID=A0ABX1JF42_9PSEU|nr:TetR/AcrR family transcriptional regulator [Amycolatopsis acididurans]NKQ57025.1 TetR/AcrR family transcriptional regulator [Amycolatopsis acididurans]